MAFVHSLSVPGDRPYIASLLRDSLGEDVAAVDARFQDWKYWAPHPYCPSTRSHVIKDGDTLLAHGCVWPIRLRLQGGCFDAFKLTDWAARPGSPGAGMNVLRACRSGMAAAFTVGGTAISNKVLEAAGFKSYNLISFLARPLRPVRSALKSRRGWKMPARIARDAVWSLFPSVKLAAGWEIAPEPPSGIPELLWPRETAGQAVSLRSADLLAHMISCPRVENSLCYVLRTPAKPVAYAVMVQIGEEVRLADYGPADLDDEASWMLGASMQVAAREAFPDAATLSATTSEDSVRQGFIRAGLRLRREKPIGVVKLHKALEPIDRFRLTALDFDALFL